MKAFEYKITKHPAETFNELIYYCTKAGECTMDQIPHDQTETLQNILNAEGATGWELIQVSFGRNGIIAFWKKRNASLISAIGGIRSQVLGDALRQRQLEKLNCVTLNQYLQGNP